MLNPHHSLPKYGYDPLPLPIRPCQATSLVLASLLTRPCQPSRHELRLTRTTHHVPHTTHHIPHITYHTPHQTHHRSVMTMWRTLDFINIFINIYQATLHHFHPSRPSYLPSLGLLSAHLFHTLQHVRINALVSGAASRENQSRTLGEKLVPSKASRYHISNGILGSFRAMF